MLDNGVVTSCRFFSLGPISFGAAPEEMPRSTVTAQPSRRSQPLQRLQSNRGQPLRAQTFMVTRTKGMPEHVVMCQKKHQGTEMDFACNETCWLSEQIHEANCSGKGGAVCTTRENVQVAVRSCVFFFCVFWCGWAPEILCVNLTDSEWRMDQRTMKVYLDPLLLCF